MRNKTDETFRSVETLSRSLKCLWCFNDFIVASMSKLVCDFIVASQFTGVY